MILALDVSGSMCATDVEPNRLTAAQAAVREFVQDQDADTRIGLVVFSGFAQVAVAPTTDREALLRAIDALTTGRGTTIGAAILKSVDAIAEINPDVAPADPDAHRRRARAAGPGRRARYAPEIVVLLTDGANTRGVEPVDAAKIAAERGVRVYPIGFGTRNPTTMVCTAAQLGGRGFEGYGAASPGGGGGGGAQLPRRRRGHAARGGRRHRRRVLRGRRRGPAAGRAGGPPAHGRDPAARRRGERRGWRGLAALLLLAGLWAAARWTAFPA